MKSSALFLLLLPLVLHVADAQFTFSSTSVGRNFIVGFGKNYGANRLSITVSSLVGANVQITNQAGTVLHSFTVAPLTAVTREILNPATYEANIFGILTSNGLRVTASADVSVYALNRQDATTDGTVVYPVESLGKEYTAVTYVNAGSGFGFDCVQVIAAHDNTQVSVDLKTQAYYNGTLQPVGVTSFTLPRALDSLAICNPTREKEVTGSVVTSDKDVAVFGFSQCAQVPLGKTFCDMLLEQMLKTTSLGLDAVVVPLLTRTAGDIVRVVATADSTAVKVDGVVVTTLNKGQFYETSTPSISATYLQADKPAFFAQYSKGTGADSVTSDPFFTSLPSSQFWLADYVVATAPGFTNYMSLVIKTTEVSSVTINGAAPPAAWTAAGTSGFSWTRFSVNDAPNGAYYRLRSSSGSPLGVQVYGYASVESYGFSGGSGFVDVAPNPDVLGGGGTVGGPSGEITSCPDCSTVFNAAADANNVVRSTSGKCLRLTFGTA